MNKALLGAVVFIAGIVLALMPTAANAHYLSLWLGNDNGWVGIDHDRLSVKDGTCGNGATARVNARLANGSTFTLYDLSTISGCDTLPSSTALNSKVVEFRLCNGNGNCTAWKDA